MFPPIFYFYFGQEKQVKRENIPRAGNFREKVENEKRSRRIHLSDLKETPKSAEPTRRPGGGGGRPGLFSGKKMGNH